MWRRICNLLLMICLFLIFYPIGSGVSLGAAGDGNPSDSNIQYIGRWDKSISSQYNSYWAGAYFRVNFTGTTIKLKVSSSNTVNLYVQLDNGAQTLYSNASGTVNLTPSPLSGGTHTLLVASRDITDTIRFQGLILDEGASTQAPNLRGQQIEFIGDSITVGYKASKIALSSYAWKTGEQLNVDHMQIAYTGICLHDNVSCYSPNAIGMSRQFFKLQTVDNPTSPDWNFNVYQPAAVVINLGTNDQVFNVADSDFQSSYITFLQNVRVKYPLAEIFVLRTFGGFKSTPTQAAVSIRSSAGDTRIHYVDTTGWLASSDYVDGTHPTDAGHQKVANRLAPILKPYVQNLAAGALSTFSSSYESSNWSSANLNDGQRNSVNGSYGWTSNNTLTANHTEYVTLDLGSNQIVNTVNLYPRNDSGDVGQNFPIDFTIQTSVDGVNWTTKVTRTGYALPGNVVQSFDFPTASVRYVKVEGTNLRQNPNDANQYRMAFAEMEIYGVNHASGAYATFSSAYESSNWSYTKLNDGQRNSVSGSYGWTTNNSLTTNHTEYVTLDLGSNQTVDTVNLYPRNDAGQVGKNFPIDFTIQTSTDGVSWTTRVTQTGYALPGNAVQSFGFGSASVRYVKVEGTNLRQNASDANQYRMAFAEIEVY
ncbi:discoidin domain-containing protein [Paenibacillus sp. Soil750]|uniref:discoidin domain-containing protein n=1 Tax=Paenibacillus sp. Soil750 TaxID=1736398 RepID=UPI0006F5CC66|nr:discoidin domain-containing protein [Paenibacillus sp. Soil750]KRE70418.1 hypothetical protein ASL11_11945 [Paenibacillus sp. Soil750]